MTDPDEALGRVRDLILALDILHHAAGRRLGLNPTDLRAIDIIARAGSITSGQLADRLSLSSGGATTVINRLVRSGHATRSGDADDRRLVVVRPTSKARQEVASVLNMPWLDFLGHRPDHELEVLEDVVDNLTQVIWRHAAGLHA